MLIHPSAGLVSLQSKMDMLRLEPRPGLPVYAPGFSGPTRMQRENRIAEMLKMARELAGHGHRPQMIEAVLAANGFPEAHEFIDQQHVWRELMDIAGRARRGEDTERAIREGDEPSGK
jgi:hypothetical protein